MAFATRAVFLSIMLVAGAANGLADGWEPDAAPSLAYHPQVMSWTGFYVGGNVGFNYTITSFDHTARPLSACTLMTGSVADCSTGGNLNSNSLIGGIQAGFNHQVGSFIWGLEGDVTWRGRDSGRATFVPAFGVVQDFAESNRWLATLRPRLGFAYYRAFIYATGGLAWGSVNRTLTFRDPLHLFPTLVTQESGSRLGWTTGVGVDYALTTHWTFRGEYLFVDLGEVNVATAGTGGWWSTNTTFSEQQHLLRAALSYRF